MSNFEDAAEALEAKLNSLEKEIDSIQKGVESLQHLLVDISTDTDSDKVMSEHTFWSKDAPRDISFDAEFRKLQDAAEKLKA